SPDDIGPRKAAAADGGGVDAADDSRNGVMLFQCDHAHSVSPDLLVRTSLILHKPRLWPGELASGCCPPFNEAAAPNQSISPNGMGRKSRRRKSFDSSRPRWARAIGDWGRAEPRSKRADARVRGQWGSNDLHPAGRSKPTGEYTKALHRRARNSGRRARAR